MEDLETELELLWQRLSPAQRTFVEERLAGRELGTKRSVAFSSSPTVRRFLDLATRAAIRKVVVTREHVLNGLLDAVDVAATSTELVNAWREIGRLIGAYEPERVDLTVRVGDLDPSKLATIPTEELIEMSLRDGAYEAVEEAAEGSPVARIAEALGMRSLRHDVADPAGAGQGDVQGLRVGFESSAPDENDGGAFED